MVYFQSHHNKGVKVYKVIEVKHNLFGVFMVSFFMLNDEVTKKFISTLVDNKVYFEVQWIETVVPPEVMFVTDEIISHKMERIE